MVKSTVLPWALGAAVMASYGCAQVLGLDHTFEPDSSTSGGGGGAGGDGSAVSSSSSSSSSSSAASSSSSGGGAGGSPGVGGAGGGSISGVEIASWTADPPSPQPGKPCYDSYSYVLPSWLAFSSPNPIERTSQIGQSELCRGYTVDVPRARNVGGGWGLSVENERKNQIKNSDSWDAIGSGWSAGTMQSNPNEPDPAGGTDATLFTSAMSPAGEYSNYTTQFSSGQAASAWLKGGGLGVPPFAHFHQYVMGPWVDVDSPTWKRYSVIQSASQTDGIALDTQDVPMGAGVIDKTRSVYAFGAQLEQNAKYPSSYIPTGDVEVSRKAELLTSAPGSLAMLTPGGYFQIVMTFAPNFAMSGAVNEMNQNEYDLIYFDTKDRVYLRRTERRLVMRLGGVETQSGVLTFDREQPLVVSVTNSPGKSVVLGVSGATDGGGEFMNAPAGPINVGLGSKVYLLSSDKGAGECSDLRSVAFFAP